MWYLFLILILIILPAQAAEISDISAKCLVGSTIATGTDPFTIHLDGIRIFQQHAKDDKVFLENRSNLEIFDIYKEKKIKILEAAYSKLSKRTKDPKWTHEERKQLDNELEKLRKAIDEIKALQFEK